MARTRFFRPDQADSDCTPGAEQNKPLLSAQTGGGETLSATTEQGQMITAVEFGLSTPSGDPGTEDLPAGSLFRCQLDITALGANQTVQVVFHALDNSCVDQGSVAMAEADFSTTGLHLATATWDPPSAARYQARVGVAQGGMHTDGEETITLRGNNSDAFYEFPDAPAADERYATRLIREAKGYVRPRVLPQSSVFKQTFPPPVFERVQSRQMRVALAPARHVPAPSARIQVFTPPPPAPPENYFTRVLRTVFAPARHVPAPSTRWKTFPPPVFERIQSRLMRVVFAPRKRSPGQGQVLKQTFPPPVFERIQSRLMRVALATRRRWQAPSKKVQVLAPPPPPPPGSLIPFLRSFRLQGRDRKRSGRISTRITFRHFIPPVPVVSGLKRIGGWFRNFWRVG